MPKSNQKIDFTLLCILLVAFSLRVFGINWDNGLHLHPDERMIIMVADRIHFFNNINPEFFNYGSLPIYLLKGLAQLIDIFFSSNVANYQEMLYLGRILSIFFDLGTVFLIYKITRLLLPRIKPRGSRICYLGSFIYAISFFPIQNAHFFTVDTLFTFLSTLLVYTLLLYVKRPSSRYIVYLSIIFAALLATKFTAIIFLPVILLTLPFSKKFSLSSLIYSLFFILASLFAVSIFMPFAFLNFQRFWADISVQLAMSKSPYLFPYTLQYVGTAPYLYYLKNIFLWGLGPVISVLAILGLKFLSASWRTKFIIFILFYFIYFLIIGMSAVKFMRYMLPLYPFFAILAGFGLLKLRLSRLFIIASIFWTLIFLNIYSKPNTRIAATEWILKNIPANSTIAVEYWDDYLPMYGSEKYYLNELHLYDLPDDSLKWSRINTQLKKTDYIVIASNRLYIPLQKLSDCSKYKICYPKTAEYYQRLFREELGFKKIKEFAMHPGIDDQSADESFTVYDHPKIMIFKRIF